LFHYFNWGSGLKGLGSFLGYQGSSSTLNGVEQPESFDEFPTRGLVILVEVRITKRMEQEQNRIEVSLLVVMGSPRPSIGMSQDRSSWA
jgi:hypothetical protein